MRQHRHEMAAESPQLLLLGQRPEQFGFGKLTLGHVDAEAQNVRLPVDFDDLRRKHNRVERAPRAAKLALEFAHRTIAPKIHEELCTVVAIQPYVQLLCVTTYNAVTVQAEPLGKRIVDLDKLAIAQPQQRNKRRAGAKGRAEARFTLAQSRLTFSQFRFGLFAFRDVQTSGNDMRLAIYFDDVGRQQQRTDRAPVTPALALQFAHRTITLEVLPKLCTVLKI